MKGLLLKDFTVVLRQMRIFLVLIAIFAVIPGYSMFGFAIVYAALIPMTALAYDERSKWDVMAAMMPYRRRDLVLSKYLLGYICMAGAALLTIVAQLVIGLVKGQPMDVEMPLSALAVLCVAALLQSISMPLMFRFGVEKGRVAFILIFGALFGIFAVAGEDALAALAVSNGALILAVLAVLTVAVSIGSVLLSEKFYRVGQN